MKTVHPLQPRMKLQGKEYMGTTIKKKKKNLQTLIYMYGMHFAFRVYLVHIISINLSICPCN